MVAAGAMDDARGRLGRPWACVPGHSFAISFIVTIPESVATDDAVNGWMSMIAGLATLDAIEGTLDECGAVPFDPTAGSISMAERHLLPWTQARQHVHPGRLAARPAR